MTVFIKRSKQNNMQRAKQRFRIVSVLFLILILFAVACTPLLPNPAVQPLLFTAEADAQVSETNPTTNHGNSTSLQVDGGGAPEESFIRFTVTGISGTVQSARLRVFATSNSSANGPAVYATETSWSETEITWQTRPARLSEALDNKDSVGSDLWVEYDVTDWVKGDGPVSFVLAADSNDAAIFSSREGNQPPQLIVTLATGPTLTPGTTTVTTTTPTPISQNTPAGPNSVTFIAEADVHARQSRPSINYGTDPTLRVDGESGAAYETFMRFSVTGISGGIESALLRLFVSTNGTRDGPAVYAADSSWNETDVTWRQRPILMGAPVANLDRLRQETWAEYDVTSLVTGDGTIGFALVADSDDNVIFSSREGGQPPQLVVTLHGGSSSSIMPILTPTAFVEDAILVGAGDISACDNENDELTAQLLDDIPGTVLTLGDNAYESGTATEFRNCYDPTWGRHKDRTKPVPGNHEYHTPDASGYFEYFDNIPSYYAYDLGHWRVYALNSEIRVSGISPQVAWLQADLVSNPRQCVLAYWHQPRWSSGSHHGSQPRYQRLWEILYEAGVEVVLNGHEHSYERFTPMDASGQPDPQGMRAFVVGTGGRDLYKFESPLPTSEVRNDTSYGVLKLTLRENSYDWEFIPIAGSTFTDSGSTDCH